MKPRHILLLGDMTIYTTHTHTQKETTQIHSDKTNYFPLCSMVSTRLLNTRKRIIHDSINLALHE